MSTPYHAKYFAHELTRQGVAGGNDRLSQAIFNASVDLNPHQIEAAHFALRSPLSKGVLLADEVGLGKTIEAGLVLCQYWSERKRRLIVICPASLRKQWAMELEEKFNLPVSVLDAKTWRDVQKSGEAPLNQKMVIILSFNYASRIRDELKAIPWNLVVIDEAHKLRNAYRESNRIGQSIRWATDGCRKLLLTATPMQNSLLELYGLSTLIDDYLFGDLDAFRSQFTGAGGDLQALRLRLADFCRRTLRNQVTEYIRYTERKTITRPFRPTDDEHRLYEAVSDFLRMENSYAIPQRQRHLTELILRKLLSSSSIAIAGTLETMQLRLEALRDAKSTPDSTSPPLSFRQSSRLSFRQSSSRNPAVTVLKPGSPLEPFGEDNRGNDSNFIESLINDEELEDELLDEILAEGSPDEPEPVAPDWQQLNEEIGILSRLAVWARNIGIDTKTGNLLSALETGFAHLATIGAARKALIFTESRRTQDYLAAYLETHGYAGQIVRFSGSNKGSEAAAIYENWLKCNADTGRLSGSRDIDIRTALIEHFRDHAQIMIATEAAAEGVNLQFCSLVVNYDLPWNPQRIEQRIGRCHRYGQKHDVVVINFLNERNDADRRVLELLTEKFNLFNGVFGASDDVLGTIESGVDFEKKILTIYQECRTQEQIETAFNALQVEMDEHIRARMNDTRKLLLEHFDEDVHERLRVQLQETKSQLDRFSKRFWELTSFMLADNAVFDHEQFIFNLRHSPRQEIKTGRYHLISKNRPVNHSDDQTGFDSYLYRLSHPLGEYVIDQAKQLDTPVASVVFDVSHHPARTHVVEALRGKSGYLTLTSLAIDSFEREEHLLFSAFDNEGRSLDQEPCEKLFACQGSIEAGAALSTSIQQRLAAEAQRHGQATVSRSLEANNGYFQQAREKLEKWADDMVLAAERALKETKEQIKLLQRQARQATGLEEQHEIQQKIQKLEKQQRRQRQEIFTVEDEIIDKRDGLISQLEKRLSQKTESSTLFTIQWAVV